MIRDHLRRFQAALQFLTIFPPLFGRQPAGVEALARAAGTFPLVGLVIGALLFGVNFLLARVFPAPVRAALTLAAWVALTGALHLDGFLDSCDGLFAGSTPQSRLEILRDERIGAYAFAGGFLLLALKFAALAAAPALAPALLLAPLLGRWSVTLAIYSFPYARQEGLGRMLKEGITGRQALFATLFALGAAGLLAGWMGLAAAAFSFVILRLVAVFACRRIPGLTGDLYGAVCELVEAAVLLLFATRAA